MNSRNDCGLSCRHISSRLPLLRNWSHLFRTQLGYEDCQDCISVPKVRWNSLQLSAGLKDDLLLSEPVPRMDDACTGVSTPAEHIGTVISRPNASLSSKEHQWIQPRLPHLEPNIAECHLTMLSKSLLNHKRRKISAMSAWLSVW